MGGISGVLKLDGSMADGSDLRRTNQLLNHRGPNGRGQYLDKEVGLAHTRLAVFDLSDDGQQPMAALGDRYWITYNGEIYNFLELRKELAELGYPFKTQTDTEVILAAWIAWGPDCVSRFNGMWAFAIWDAEERKLFLSRDRFGIKPLYYYHDEKVFAFASEVKALLGIESIRLFLDKEGVDIHFSHPGAVYASASTIWKGVYSVLPGHQLTISILEPQIKIKRWWNTLEHLPSIPSTPKGQVEQFYALFMDSVQLRMRSDIPVGVSLSGGMNSSSVMALMQSVGKRDPFERMAPEWKKACFMKFSKGNQAELKSAERFAKELKVDLTMLREGVIDLEEELFRLIFACEAVDPLYLCRWMIYQGLRQSGIRVTLDTHGVNESLGGDPESLLSGSFDSVAHLLTQRRALNNPAEWKEIVKQKQLPLLSRLAPKTSINADKELKTNWTEDMSKIADRGLFFRSRYYQTEGGALQSLLSSVDVTSMAHGVETRMPFLDWRLYCYCLALPATICIRNGVSKFVMREAMKESVPEKILGCRERSTYPDLLESVFPAIKEVIQTKAFQNYPYFQGNEVIRLIEEKKLHQAWPYVQLFLLDHQFQNARDDIFNG